MLASKGAPSGTENARRARTTSRVKPLDISKVVCHRKKDGVSDIQSFTKTKLTFKDRSRSF